MENQTRKNLKHRSVLFILAAFLCCIINTSCQKEEVYSHFYEIKDARWVQTDTLVFEINSTLFELDTPYNLSLEVTNNVNYPYRNIWFFIQDDIKNINDSTLTSRSEEYQLADEFGRWFGDGFGTLYQSSFPLGTVTFRERKDYYIKVEHGMRDESLEGIEKIGIRISIPKEKVK